MADNVVSKLKERVNEFIEEFEGLKSSIDEASEWDTLPEIISNIGNMTSFVINVILAVELSANELMDEVEAVTSGEKLEAAAEVLDELLDLPWYLEVIDGPAFKILISFGVSMLNKYLGNDWDLDAAREALSQGTDFIKTVLGTD